jgi:DNA-binding PadR family transcriptional regulator
MPSSSRNLWSLTVLCLLRVRPMHPYEMQRLIREWKKDDFLDLKRGSLYHAIERLRAAGLIEAVETSREGRRPERTVYRITAPGKQEMLAWLRELLANPARSPTEFYAALSFLPALAPADALEQLDARAGLLEAEVANLTRVLETMTPRIGRLVLLEVEYTRAVRQAELAWVRTVIEDVRAGRLAWDLEAICRAVGGPGSPPCA